MKLAHGLTAFTTVVTIYSAFMSEETQYLLVRLAEALFKDIVSPIEPLPEAAKMSVPDQIRANGLSFEALEVTTDDGYINELWHVWDPETLNRTHEPIYFNHGLIDTAGTWFYNTPDKAPAYMLAKQGYDIWLGNNRGQVYSYKHVNLTVEDSAYWDHSFHEMAMYDQPAFIKAVLNATGASQVHYVGHSQGTLQFWLANMLHDYESYGKHIKSMIAYAPVLYVGNQTSIIATLAIRHDFDILSNKLWDSVLWLKDGYNWLYSFINKVSPKCVSLVPRMVWTVVQAIVGFDKKSHMAPSMMPMMARNDVGGASTTNLMHYGQLVRTGRIETLNRKGDPSRPYDEVKLAKNLKDTDVLLFVGETDALVAPDDFKILKNLLPSSKTTVREVADYNHLDYMWAKDTDSKVNEAFIDFIQKHTG